MQCTVNSFSNCALGDGGAEDGKYEDVKFIMREGRVKVGKEVVERCCTL